MRKSLVLAALAGLYSSPVQAQSVEGYGLRAGANTSTMVYEIEGFAGAESLDRELGFQAAAFVEVGTLLPFLSALVEAEYARRSYQWNGVVETSEVLGEPDGTFQLPASTLHYVSVPVLAKLQAPGLVAPYAIVGPRLDVLVGSSAGSTTREIEGSDEPVLLRDDLPDALETVGLSAVVGAGIGLGGILGPEVRVEARYGFGLTNRLDSDAIDWRGNGLDVSLALAF